jgi:hypothetical protein
VLIKGQKGIVITSLSVMSVTHGKGEVKATKENKPKKERGEKDVGRMVACYNIECYCTCNQHPCISDTNSEIRATNIEIKDSVVLRVMSF